MKPEMKLSKRYPNSSLTRLAVYCFATGIGFGFVFLGLGGRMVMRIISISNGRPPVFSFEGTIIILIAGGIAGGTAGVIWAILKMCLNKSWVVIGIWYVTLFSFSIILTIPEKSIFVSSLFGFLFIIFGVFVVFYLKRKTIHLH